MIPPILRRPVPIECATPPGPPRCRTSGPDGPAPTPRTRTRHTPALTHHRITLGPPRDPSGEKDSLHARLVRQNGERIPLRGQTVSPRWSQ